MKIVVTGASGLIGRRLVAALRGRGDEVTALSRRPEGGQACWNVTGEHAPAMALAGRDAVIHLAGESVAQRWTGRARRAIRDSRVLGTHNLVEGLREADPCPSVLICASAVGIYGDRGDERLDERSTTGSDFLAQVCVDWERAAGEAAGLGMRVASMRTGVVLDRAGGALAQMLPAFRAGIGGPIAGGRQYVPWIHAVDVVGMYLTALTDTRWTGPINMTSPSPERNRDFSKALGRALRRPALVPVPALAVRALYGDMAEVVTGGQNAVPARATDLGYRFAHTDVESALRAALS